MSVTDELIEIQEKNKSMICLGLDLDPKRMPAEYTKSPRTMFEFANRIIDATKDVVCAYKPNMAFYESLGPEGLSLLRLIIERIPDEIPVILDGKRGDIGNTASHYAEALFERYGATWITVNPYMGYDSLRPFLEYKDCGIFILCLTSNKGSSDFQMLNIDGKPLYQVVAEKVAYWNKDGNCGLVVGATQPEQLKVIREVAGDMALLIPGVGAQGGSLELASRYGTDDFKKPAVINVSRSVLYASLDDNFAQRAREELRKLNDQIRIIRSGGNISENLKPAPQPEPEQESVKVAPTEPSQTVKPDPQQSTPPPKPESDNNFIQENKPSHQQPEQPRQESKPEPTAQPSQPVYPKPEEKPQPSAQVDSKPEPEEVIKKEEPTQDLNENHPPPPRPLGPPPPLPQFSKPDASLHPTAQEESKPEPEEVIKKEEPKQDIKENQPPPPPRPLGPPPPLPQFSKPDSSPHPTAQEELKSEPEEVIKKEEPKQDLKENQPPPPRPLGPPPPLPTFDKKPQPSQEKTESDSMNKNYEKNQESNENKKRSHPPRPLGPPPPLPKPPSTLPYSNKPGLGTNNKSDNNN